MPPGTFNDVSLDLEIFQKKVGCLSPNFYIRLTASID